MAENDGNDLVVRIGGDATGFDKAADSAVKKLDELEKKVVAGTQEIDKRTEALSAAEKKYAEQLKTRYDPVYAAQKRYIAELANIDRAVKLNALNEEAATAAFQKALSDRTAAIQRAAGLNNTLAGTSDMAAASARRMGSAVQQAGFQIGDFAVQVASGSGVLRPFIQQGTQLVSAFGPWGAAIGAVGAVVGALAVQFLDVEDAAKKWTTAQDSLNKSLEKTNGLLLSQVGLSAAQQKKAIEEGKAALQKSIQDNTDLIVAAEEEAQKLRVRFSGTPANDKFAQQAARTVSELEERIAKARDQINKAVEDFATLENEGAVGRSRDSDNSAAAQQDKDRAAAAERGAKIVAEQAEKRKRAETDAEKEAERRRKLIRDADTDNAAQQDKDRLAAMKRGAEIIKQDEERAQKFERYLVGLESENKLLGVSSEERRLQNALIEAQQQKGSALNDVERQRVETAQRVGEAFRRQKAVADEIERSFERAFDRIGSAITTMFVEGKASALDFKNVALAVVGEIAQEFIKLAAINPLKNALFGTNSPTLGDTGGLFGGGGGFLSGLGSIFSGMFAGGSPGYGGIDYGGFASQGIGYVGPSAFHTGGIVGADTGRPMRVANDTFAGAPRFHSGLMPDEFPAILQKGEGVFTPAQMRAMGGSKVEIIDQRGANAPDIEQEMMTDGRVRLLIREAAPAIVKASVSEVRNRAQRGDRS